MPLALFLKAKRIEMRTRKDGVVQRYHVGSEEEIGEVQRQQGHVETTHSKMLRAHAEHGVALLAPNGKPSNLNRKQWISVRTPSFKRWFGDWEAATRLEELRNMKAVPAMFHASENESFRQARMAARLEYDKLRKATREDGYGVQTRDERRIKFSAPGFKEVAHHASDRRLFAVTAHLKPLFEAVVPLYSTAPNRQMQQVRAFHYYATKGDFGRTKAYVLLEVIERNDGEFFYDADATSVEEIEATSTASLTVRPQAGAGGGRAAPKGRLAKWWAGVNSDASKVTDANGEPLVVYHGTGGKDSGFSVFRTPAWFNTSPEYASEVGNWSEDAAQNVMPVYLSIRKPYRIDGDKRDADTVLEAQRADLQERGYDGIFVGYESGENDWIAFRSTQIKSAVGNVGTFRTDIEHLNKALPSSDKTSAYRDAIRRKLAGLAVLQHQIDKTNTRIRKAAEHRLSAVQREIHSVRPRSWTDPGAADRYRELVLERGHLKRLLGS